MRDAKMFPFHCFIVFVASMSITACSTRHVANQYVGSTEQRLVTHSLDKLLNILPKDAFSPLSGKEVYLQSYFVMQNPLTSYAHERLAMELAERFNVNLTSDKEIASHQIRAFFTSIGTDRDKAGFSFPLIYAPEDDARADIPLIAIDMYHGISEFYYYITDTQTGEVTKSPVYKATIKSDKIATPFISIPITNLK